MQNTLKQIWLLVTPSWLSGLVGWSAALAIVIGTIVLTDYNGSGLQQQLFEAKNGSTTVSALGLQTVTDNLARNHILANLPLFLFWALLGLIVYLFAVSLWSSLGHAVETEKELAYVHAPRHQMVQEAILHLAIRLVVLIAWLFYISISIKWILPYVLAVAHVAATGLTTFSGIGYALLAATIVFATAHFHAVFLRFVLLRVRVFG